MNRTTAGTDPVAPAVLLELCPQGWDREEGGCLTLTGVTVALTGNKIHAYFLSGFRIAFSWSYSAKPGSFAMI